MGMITIFMLAISICMVFSSRNNVCDSWIHYNIKDTSSSCRYNPDVGANTVRLATRYNYQIQTHHVETEDGYILTIFRIATSTNLFNSSRQPIILQHGSLTDSTIWLQRGQDSIGFLLANMGFDVWLGNTRGNYNSPGHRMFTPDNIKYWDHSFDDLARDPPAVIDYIAKETNRGGDILYVGHSAGSTQALAYASDRPEHSKRNLKAIICFAPAVYLPKISFLGSVVRILINLPIDKIDFRTPLSGIFCTYNAVTVEWCKYFLRLNFGVDNNIDPALFPVFIARFPDREALKPFVQYIQFTDTSEFKKFDYEREQNLRKYGTASPPKYDLAKIPTPVYTFIGTADEITTLSNARKFHNELLVENKIFELLNYTHISFYLSYNVHKVLYRPFFKLLEKLRERL